MLKEMGCTFQREAERHATTSPLHLILSLMSSEIFYKAPAHLILITKQC